MQWRGSNDGIVWSPWAELLDVRELLPPYEYYQGRILVDGKWRVSMMTAHDGNS